MGFLDATDYKEVARLLLDRMWYREYQLKTTENKDEHYKLLIQEIKLSNKEKVIIDFVNKLVKDAHHFLRMEKSMIRRELLSNEYDSEKEEKPMDEIWGEFVHSYNKSSIKIFNNYFYLYREIELKELYEDMKRLKEKGYPYTIFER